MLRLHPAIMGGGGVQKIKRQFGFWAPFSDLGAGAVDTTLARGTGTATFTRASVATTTLSTGLIGAVGTGVARSCYSPSGIYLGYLAEGAATQLVTPTASIRDMTDASWVATTMTPAKTSVGWDGAASSATRLTATGAGATILQTLVAAASSRTYSCGIRRVTGTGTIKLVQGATKSADLSASLNSSTYTKVELAASVLNAAYGIEIGTSGDAIDVDFNQFEAGAISTSRIVTAGATRAADALSYVTSGNMSNTVGSSIATITSNKSAGSLGSIVDSYNGSEGAPLGIGAGNILTLFDGAQRNISASITRPIVTAIKVASRWSGVECAGAVSGTLLSGVTFDGDMGFGASFAIGDNIAKSNSLYGTIRDVMISTQALSDGESVALTT